MRKKNSALQEQWVERIGRQRASGMTQKAWCAAEGVSHNTMQGWIKRLGMQARQQSPEEKRRTFVKVIPTDSPERLRGNVSENEIEMIVVRLKLPSSYDGLALGALIGAFNQ